MPPVLKTLSLVTTILCVILFFGVFAFDGRLHKNYISLQHQFNTSRKNSFLKNDNNNSQAKAGGGVTASGASSTKNYIPQFDFSTDGTSFEANATTSVYVDPDTLERLGGNYYKGTDAIYYRIHGAETCSDPIIDKVIKLPIDDITKVTSATRGNVITDQKSVFVYYLKLQNADQKSFQFVGQATIESNDGTARYWYKDNKTIYVIKATRNDCTGGEFSVDDGSAFNNVDVSTFEYIGSGLSTTNTAYAKDKNYFYNDRGSLSETVTPKTCTGDFFKECLPQITTASTSPR